MDRHHRSGPLFHNLDNIQGKYFLVRFHPNRSSVPSVPVVRLHLETVDHDQEDRHHLEGVHRGLQNAFHLLQHGDSRGWFVRLLPGGWYPGQHVHGHSDKCVLGHRNHNNGWVRRLLPGELSGAGLDDHVHVDWSCHLMYSCDICHQQVGGYLRERIRTTRI